MKAESSPINRSTWITAAVLGTVIAISGMQHGIFEILQGNTTSEYNIIHSIGPDQQNWANGEEVFTLVPNFLVTGIIALIISIFIVIWSLGFLHTAYGPTIFILLYIFLTLTGGGIGHLLFFLPVWIYSMRIRRSISWKGKPPSVILSRTLSAIWLPMLMLTSLTFIAALETAMLGLPGASDQQITTTIIVLMLTSLVSLNFAFLAALVRDIQKNTVTA